MLLILLCRLCRSCATTQPFLLITFIFPFQRTIKCQMSSRGRGRKSEKGKGEGKGLSTEATAGHLFLLSAVKCKKCLMPSTAQRTPNKQALGSAAYTLRHTHTHTHNHTLAHPLGEKVKPLGFNQKLRGNQKKRRRMQEKSQFQTDQTGLDFRGTMLSALCKG